MKKLICIFLLALTRLWASSDSVLLEEARRCHQILKTSLVDYYLPAVIDRSSGGYFENWQNGKFVPTDEKFLVMQARHLWFFSTLIQEGIKTNAAKIGYDFLENKMRDRRYGGYFCKVTDVGAPKDRRKHMYLSAFALYGLAAYYEASKDPGALAAAQDLFFVLEEKAYDRTYGGFIEFFTEDWRPITDPKIRGPLGPGNIKTYNTHLHVLEALTGLYRVWPDPRVKERLIEILHINTKTLRHPNFPCNINEWHFDWSMVQTSQNFEVHYGHELECAWLVLEAARALDLPLEPYVSFAISMCDYCMQYGYDQKHGGFFYGGPPGEAARDTKKEWWVQSEALVALLEVYRLTGKEEYHTAFRRTLDFIEKYQVAPGGSWWATCTAEGRPSNKEQSSPWHGAYHNGRAMILSAKILEELCTKSRTE